MPIRLNDFQMPQGVKKDEATATSRFGRYTAEPFEIGYARTIGNSLRRVLLSSIEGCAISSVKIEGAPHEFCSLPGVKEDVTDIVLSLKKVLVKSYAAEPQVITVQRKGPCVVTAGDLAEECGNIEVLNPEHPIATVNEEGTFQMEVKITKGRGFCPATWDTDPNAPENADNRPKQQEIGVIPIDRIYSPVIRVNFEVSNTRVGQKTDYERLVLEISTDGRVEPDEALLHATDILRHHLDVFINFNKSIIEEIKPIPEVIVEDTDELRRKLAMSVNEIELSVRSANCLNNAKITTVGQLCTRTVADMLKFRNFGKKSLNEIEQKLHEMGLALGMKLDPSLLPPQDHE